MLPATKSDLLQILEQITAAADHFQQTTVGVVVVLMLLQMSIQVVDAAGQDCDLNLRRTGIALVGRIRKNDLRLFFLMPAASRLSFVSSQVGLEVLWLAGVRVAVPVPASGFSGSSNVQAPLAAGTERDLPISTGKGR